MMIKSGLGDCSCRDHCTGENRIVDKRFAAFAPSCRSSWSVCVLLISAVASCWCQGIVGDPPPAENFTIVQHLGNAPDLSSYGIQPLASVWQTRLFTSCTDDTPFDTPRLKMELDRVDKSPIPTMLDIECWNLWNDADYPKNLSRMRNVLAAVRKARPDMQFGFFGIIPPTAWRWTTLDVNSPAFKQRWKTVNQKGGRDFVPYVDALFMDLYTIVPDSARWEAYASMVLQTARQFNKPAYCLLWPQYYDLDQRGERGPYLEPSYWRLELDTCYRYADGIVLYDEPRGKKWDPNAPWWQETLSFLQTHGWVRSKATSSVSQVEGPSQRDAGSEQFSSHRLSYLYGPAIFLANRSFNPTASHFR